MASPEPCSAPTRSRFPRGPPAAAAASDGRELPFDLMLDVLLRVPAKDLCRLRAVCRGWRAATADPHFVRAHAARHPDPLFLAKIRDDDAHIQVVDLSGAVVKKVAIPEGHELLCTRLDLACMATHRSSCRLVNPATGASRALPESPTPEHAGHENLRRLYTDYAAFGRVPSTGEYKVLRIFNRPEFTDVNKEQLFEVFTVNGGGADRARWRAKQPRSVIVEVTSPVVVDGVVYFKIDCVYHTMLVAGVNPGVNQDSIFSFDLETEEWRGELQGPIGDNLDDDFDDIRCLWIQLTLADLKGALALVHYRDHRSLMDLWLLEDFERGIWVKKYSIQTESKIPSCDYPIKSFFVLDDGRFLIHFEQTGLLLIYDPRFNTSVQVEMKHLDAVAVYTGNLLSLQAGCDMV